MPPAPVSPRPPLVDCSSQKVESKKVEINPTFLLVHNTLVNWKFCDDQSSLLLENLPLLYLGAMEQDKIRNFCIIAHTERCAYETPILGFSSRHVRNKSELGLLFPDGSKT